MKSLPNEAKVVVIGGGIAGCSTAYHLAKNGWNTVLIERDVLTSGTTWHAAGMITQLGTTPQITKIRKNSVKFYKDLKKIKRGSKEFAKELDLEKSKMNIQRFKGLGEMNPEELWSTTLDPETRNLLQVQYSKDLNKDQSLIHTLMGNDVALRKDFIISNAINVQNLDI